jgi:glycosyltransferase involved in cell wall biosynthesis
MALAANADIAAMAARLGRPPRILHIGNIANNAYNNARIQRQYGIEADVLSYDYYHVMSTPEWEDATFQGEVDPDCPNWWGTSLRGWRRPDWFVQGPVAGCLQYLRACHLGLEATQRLLWRYLEACCLGQVRYRAQQAGGQPQPMPLRLGLALEAATALGVDRGPSRRIDDATLSTLFALRAADGSPLFRIAQDDADNAELLPLQGSAAPRSPAKGVPAAEKQSGTGLAARPDRVARRMAWSLLRRLAVLAHHGVKSELAALRSYHAAIDQTGRDRQFLELVTSLQAELEAIPLDQRNKFIGFYALIGAQFLDIFKFYDIVQGYSTDGGLCLMNGHGPFVSYEHGTLRDLPFGNDFYGLVTRAVYAASARVFVTNSDVLPSVDRMGLTPDRVICLPHAFDDRKLMRFRAENPDLQPPEGPTLFFSPTRQHWQDKSGSWTKGNDVLLRAAAILAGEGLDFRLHLVEWGKELAASKALIEELGIADKVAWLPTMQKRELWAAYCTAHAVVDQFTLPALGGVGFEAMALGRRLITSADESQLSRFFGEPPPCFAAASVADCAAQMRRVIADPADEAGFGERAARWMSTYHSAERIVSLQATAYRQLVEATPSSRAGGLVH